MSVIGTQAKIAYNKGYFEQDAAQHRGDYYGNDYFKQLENYVRNMGEIIISGVKDGMDIGNKARSGDVVTDPKKLTIDILRNGRW